MHLGKNRIEEGFEFIEIIGISEQLITEWLDNAELYPQTVGYVLRGWYLNEGKPKTEDIVDAQVEARGAGFVVILKIKRGWPLLNEFIRRHKTVEINTYSAMILAYCEQCGVSLSLSLNSLGSIEGDSGLAKRTVTQIAGSKTCNNT